MIFECPTCKRKSEVSPGSTLRCACGRQWLIQQDFTPYITIFRDIEGWQSCLMLRDPQTNEMRRYEIGYGPYGHSKEAKQMAIRDALLWAFGENLEYRDPK